VNILIIAPHPDDEAIGCGGAVCLRVEAGDTVGAVFLTSGELGLAPASAEDAIRTREAEAAEAGGILGISTLDFLRLPDQGVAREVRAGATRLAPILERSRPGVVYLPHPGEQHPDHAASLPLVRNALAIARIAPPELRGYEIWTPLAHFEYVEDITRVMPRKLEAIRSHRSQVAKFRYDRAAVGLNQYRGVLAGGCEYAEVMAWLDPSGG
jgi:N-acetylglucosamine malate deacetylase 1